MAIEHPDLNRYLDAIDAELRLVVSGDQVVREFYTWLRYQLGWADETFQPASTDGGKRLRPVFCLLACESVCGRYEDAVPAAAAIELVHNFSLVHDDVEDGDRLRRHRPALWALVGVSHAINAGDALFALAQRELLQLAPRGVAPERVLRASEIFQNTCVRLVEGQFLDMRAEQSADSDLAAYKRMIGGKTAALLGAAIAVGAAIATDDARQIQRFQEFGTELGMAFQMTDDILGLWGDAAVTGKPAGADLRRKKKSLPVVLALSHGGELSASLRHALALAEMSDADVEQVMTLMDSAGIRKQAELEAEKHRHRAARGLSRLASDGMVGATALESLAGLCESLTNRKR